MLVVPLYVCLRRFGELPALAGSVLAACLVAADGVNADNHVTALALSVLGLVALERRRLVLTGLAAGAAALFSAEFVVVAPLAATPLLLRRRGLGSFGAGFGAALLPYAPL